MLSKSSSNPEAQIFTLQESTNISCWQKYVVVMAPILINKDVFDKEEEAPVTEAGAL